MKTQALIIDDNPKNIVVLQQLLSIEDVESIKLSSTNHLAADLDALEAPIDIVFLDLEMPEMNGYEAIKVIRAHPNFQATKVVVYSVHVSELHVAFETGFDAFLGKPLSAESFPEQLKRIMDGEKVWYLP